MTKDLAAAIRDFHAEHPPAPFVPALGQPGELAVAVAPEGRARRVVLVTSVDGSRVAHILLASNMTDQATDLDWPALARPGQTLVFYMGVQRAAHIAAQLMAHGLPEQTPAAIVRDGTRATEEVLATGLASLAQMAPAYGPRPGLLIVGQTVGLSPHYRAAQATPVGP